MFKETGGAMPQKPEKAFNSRTYQGQVERELIVGGSLVGCIVGGGLIALIWGGAALVTALIVVGFFLGLIALVWMFLKLLEIASRD
jgi:hypothetical protein